MSRSKSCIIIRNDDPHSFFMGLYRTGYGGVISTWSNDIVDAYRFDSIATARRFIQYRMPKPVAPFCRVKVFDIVQKKGCI